MSEGGEYNRRLRFLYQMKTPSGVSQAHLAHDETRIFLAKSAPECYMIPILYSV
jgi:hypothetical protein